MPSLRMSLTIWSLPCSIASSRRSLVKYCRIFERARCDLTKVSQSRDGPAFGDLEVNTSTTSPLSSVRLEGDQPAVDAGADGAVADLGVDGVGEVDRRRPDRQRLDLAARGEDVDLGPVDLEPQGLEELPRVVDLALPVEQLAHPRHVVVVAGAVGVDALAAVLLVLPVRGDAVLRPPVHGVGADLHLHGLAVRAHDRRVQRLVHVELRHRDEVLEPARGSGSTASAGHRARSSSRGRRRRAPGCRPGRRCRRSHDRPGSSSGRSSSSASGDP